MSVATNDLLLPRFTHGPGLSVDELRETKGYDPVSAAPLFARTRSGMDSGLERPYSEEQQKELAVAWWSGVRDHPREYLAHRLNTTALLFGRHDERTVGLAYYPARSGYRDNPALPATWNPSAHQALIDLAGRLRSTWLFGALPYVLAHLTLLILACCRRRDPRAAIVLGVTCSSLVYAASFTVLAPSVELRFMTWPIVAAPLALLLWFAPIKAHLKEGRKHGSQTNLGSRSPSDSLIRASTTPIAAPQGCDGRAGAAILDRLGMAGSLRRPGRSPRRGKNITASLGGVSSGSVLCLPAPWEE